MKKSNPSTWFWQMPYRSLRYISLCGYQFIIFVILCAVFSDMNAQSTTKIAFSIDASALKNQKNLGIRGNISPLNWDKTFYLNDEDGNGIFEGTLNISCTKGTVLEYKYVYENSKTTWELDGENRFLLIDTNFIGITDKWNINREFDFQKVPKIRAEQLSTDFQIFKKALLEIHPGLYRYQSKHKMDSIFNHFQKVFEQPQSYQEAFLNFTQMTASIQCGHTFPNFYNQNGFVKKIVLDQNDKWPLTFRIWNQKIIIMECVDSTIHLPRGTEIVAIDGIPVQQLLKETASLVKADGPNDAKRYADLNTFGINNYFEMFDCYFPLLYPPTNHQYTLTVQQPFQPQTEEVQINTISRTERNQLLLKKYPDHLNNSDQLWQLEWWDHHTAYLRLGTFDVFQLSFEWDVFLKNAFKDIKKRKIKNLILDIRWNEGGQDEVLLLLGKYLAKTNLIIPQRQELVRFSTISPELKPYLFTWDKTFFDLSNKVKPYNDDYFLFNQTPLPPIKPLDKAFEGDTYILLNAANSSATFYLAEIAQINHLATLIGETTGGSQRGLNGGALFFLRLPNSQIEIDIPIIGSFSNDKPAEGIRPDVLVCPSLEDIINNEDRVIRTTQSLIKKN